MTKFKKFVEKAAGFLSDIAGWAVVAAMVIVVINVIGRKIFKSPIMGAFEYVSFLTSIAISFGIAYCAVTDGHIMIGVFTEKLKERTQRVISIITNLIALAFLVLCTVRIVMYAGGLFSKGEVSATTQTPFYIFVYMMAAGFGMLCLILITKIAEAFWRNDAE